MNTVVHIAKQGYEVWILGDIQNLTGGDPEKPDLADPALSRGYFLCSIECFVFSLFPLQLHPYCEKEWYFGDGEVTEQ